MKTNQNAKGSFGGKFVIWEERQNVTTTAVPLFVPHVSLCSPLLLSVSPSACGLGLAVSHSPPCLLDVC